MEQSIKMWFFCSKKTDVRFWAVLVVVVCLIKAIFLFFDHEPFFFLGDSAVYVRSAITNQMPSDRSFSYGMVFIRAILAMFGSLRAVVVVQGVMDAFLALVLAVLLDRVFRAPRWIVALAAILYTVEPLSLMHERFMMTETLSTFCFVLFLAAAIIYLSRPRVLLLAAMAAISFAIVALRISLLPALVVVMVAAPLMARFAASPSTACGRGKLSVIPRLTHVAAACVMFFCFQALYMEYYHVVTRQPLGYNSTAGLFLLAAWVPLVRPIDFPDSEIGKETLRRVTFPLSNRFVRPNHLFSRGGLMDTLKTVNGGEAQASTTAMHVARSIAWRNPVGVLNLARRTYLDFWNPKHMDHDISIPEGLNENEVDQDLVDYFRNVLGEDITRHHLLVTISKRWYQAARPWYLAVLLTPAFFILAWFSIRRRRPEIGLQLIVSLTLMAVVTVPVTESLVRYLHPMAWLCLLSLMLLLSRLARPLTVGSENSLNQSRP